MNTITLNLPENLEIDLKEIYLIIAAKLYEKGKLSAGQAADLVGLSKRAFIELLGKYETSVFSNDVSGLINDIKNA